MPLGFERLNERTSRPNPLINFIKPLPGSTFATAQDFLERIAAQCFPVMKANYIAVMALEEYEWNSEFIGRNFNAGEIIQLVLRSRSGAWLPFKYVQMTMMHELAHCKQMNHSGAFWKVRNAYAGEMRALWAKKYAGEGLWGRGQNLESGRFMAAPMPDQAELPEHMCGGTYRRRGKKRKRGGAAQDGKPQMSYAERKQRRILKKFGTGGVALGNDEDTRVKLEDGKKPKGKPRVAGSNRGRELRAAAALARFDQTKKEEIKKEDDATDSDTEDDEYDWTQMEDEAAVQRDGKDFVRTCEAEDEDDDNVKREMEELYDLSSIPKAPPQASGRTSTSTAKSRSVPKSRPPAPSNVLFKKPPVLKQESSATVSDTESDSEPDTNVPKDTPITSNSSSSSSRTTTDASENTCAACSLTNDSSALICIACSHVLKPAQMPNHWRCTSSACQGGAYINVGDYGLCQVCGAAKPP